MTEEDAVRQDQMNGKSDVATPNGRSRKKKDRQWHGTLTRLNKRYC